MFKSLAISKRVALGISIPLMGLLIVGSVGTWNAYNDYNKSNVLGYVTEAVNELAALTDTLQVERGQTAIMIGSGSNTPQLGLIAARKAADDEIKKIRIVNEHVHHSGDADLIAGLDDIEDELKDVRAMRTNIDSGAVKSADAMKFYTETISHILELGFIAAKKSNNAELALETIAMLELGSAKEYAGQERGLVAGILSSDTITEAHIVTLERSIGKQESLLESFLHAQPLTTYKRFKAMVADVDTAKVDDIRHEVADSAFGKRELTTTPKEWFVAATKRIEALRRIEIEVIKVVDTGAKHVNADYLSATLLVGLVSLFSLIGAIVAGFFISSSIRRDILNTSDEMKALAEGDTSFEISGIGEKTEIGNMAEAIQVFKENTIARVEMESQAEEEEARAVEARTKDAEAKAQQQHEVQTVVSSLGNALQRLASGDLSKGISTEYASEFAQLKNDFGDSIARLSSAMNEISETTIQIGDDSNELRIAADDLAKRTEQQAAALEQTSAALEEITGTVRESSERANEAREKAGIAKESTAKSSLVVQDAVNAMQRIESASGEIENIISVIDEIAFQTNLLALNAGVEAARAGEAGKGFAVVAQEVRELAGRSATAAKQIKELITNSGEEVSTGVSLVKATGEALTEISEQVIEIDTHIQSIARASSEQSEGLNEVNKAVNEMDQVTQRNAAMVEETNAVTHRLSEEASTLTGLVGQFQTDKTAIRAAKASAPKQAAPSQAAPSQAAPSQAAPSQAAPSQAAPRQAAVAATQAHSAVKSPARAMVNKVAASMGSAAAADTDWDEF